MKNILKPKEMSELLGVSVKTLQRWDKEDKLKAYRNPSGRRYYTKEQYESYMGIQKENKVGKTVIYARVSNGEQKDDLANQVEFLKQFANARGLIIDEVITDIGSGLNYNRKRWNKLIDESLEGNVKSIIIAHKDRFIRFGYDWFERLLKKQGTDIIVVNNEKLSPSEELTQDLISIIHVFSCRIYGLRKYKQKIRKDDQL
ncbi:IS607 family transposase [Savagea faecisuis]|uniref:IS607 family transposase n=1 Tax=Savagea faecisuis TaxID=1274803 RepID=A0ABW3H2R3_9BACL